LTNLIRKDYDLITLVNSLRQEFTLLKYRQVAGITLYISSVS